MGRCIVWKTKIDGKQRQIRLDIQNRIRNLMWTVSQDYELDIEVDPEAWQKSKYIAFYDAVRHGGFARYFSVEEYESYITKKVYAGWEPSVLLALGRLCIDCAVYKKLEKERRGVASIRRKAMRDTLEKDSMRLTHTDWGNIEACYLRYMLDKTEADERNQRLIELICTLEDAEDTSQIVNCLGAVYEGAYAKGFTKKFKGLSEELRDSEENSKEYTDKENLEEESEEEAQAPAAEDPAEGEAADQAVKTAEEAENATIDLADLLGDQVRTPLEAGTTITIEQNCPLLVVSTVEEATVTREIAPALETQDDDTMFLGQQRVIQEGQAGQANVLSRVVKRCGIPVASNDLNAVTVTEATPLIVGTGTKAMPELPDGCLFLWPVQGTITSEFGYRYIFGETNFHRGLDIAAPEGTAINAAADGTVTFAGERGTYGNLVVITHENGFVTYYAHCSKILAEVGDEADPGDPCGRSGVHRAVHRPPLPL